jgi:Carboxypeptidase regulatory-like domain/TonB dependent receptor-like, beta-barrel/TonB-dependent Receptor Plug Domain
MSSNSSKMGAVLRTWVVLAFSLLAASHACAQVAGATLSGTVTDASAAVIPNAEISVKNVATGVTRHIAADASGFYSAPNLLPGNYEITVSSPGFATEVRTGIGLQVGVQQVLNITMRVGQVTEKVQVTGQAPAVQLATSSISAVVNSTTVRGLPLNGRSWTDLANLQPGVVAIQAQPPVANSLRGQRGFAAQISVAGARPTQNNYRLDGISINDYTNTAPGSLLGGSLGVDAIQEFSVLTSNYSAEYGRTSGGVVNAITRSGTNEFHGSAYEFLRNNTFDARNFFDGKIPPFRRNQFGADAGGPIRKDKLFVFGDYEGIRQSKGITSVNTVPSAAARGGTLCSAPDTTPACATTTITVDPSAQKYLPFWPLPNGGIRHGTNGDIGIFTFPAQQVINENFFTIRVDNKISDKDSLVATYVGDATPYNSPGALDSVLIAAETNRQIATLEETRIFSSTLVNSGRIGYSREGALTSRSISAINPLAKDPSLAAIPGFFASAVAVGGLTTTSGGLNPNGNHYYWNSFQAYDDAFWTHGTHSVKFGGAVERIDWNMLFISSAGGTFTFGSLPNFLLNKPKKLEVSFPQTLTSRGIRQTIFGLYTQDDWRARTNLMVNMGLRWEMSTVPTEVQGKLAHLINPTDPTPQLGSLFSSNSTLRNFEPRVGFSWDPLRNGKTAVRGGFGVFDVLPLPYGFIQMINTLSPFSLMGQVNKLPAGSFYAGAYPLVTPKTGRAAYLDQTHRDYVMQWNLNVQRDLAPNLTGMLGYIGSRGVHEYFRVDDINIVLPLKTSEGWLFPSPVGSGAVINPHFGDIFYNANRGNSFYDALEVGVQKRMGHGVQLQGSYTWGKGIDTGSATTNGDQYSNSISSLPWYDIKSIRGLSDFNISRTLVLNGTWQVPSLKSFSGPAAWITNGWELSGIFKVSDGVPFTATFGTDGDPQGLNSSDTWALPNRLTGPRCQSLINPGNPNDYIKTQCFAIPTAPSAAFYTANCDPNLGTFPQCFNLRGNAGRNIMIGPGTSNLDFSVFKNNYIRRFSESFNVQFRAEFFNILNRANFAVPSAPNSTDIFDSSGAPTGVAGLLTSTTTTAREIQFALKVIW